MAGGGMLDGVPYCGWGRERQVESMLMVQLFVKVAGGGSACYWQCSCPGLKSHSCYVLLRPRLSSGLQASQRARGVAVCTAAATCQDSGTCGSLSLGAVPCCHTVLHCSRGSDLLLEIWTVLR